MKRNFYILTETQKEQIQALNTSTVHVFVMDFGSGPCIGENDLEHEAFSAHKALLDSFEIELTEIEIPDPF